MLTTSARQRKYFFAVILMVGEFLRIDYKLSMPKKPKSEEVEKEGNWSEDQKEHEYYYDDAHGYEEYDPGDDEEEGETGRQEEGEKVRK